MSRTYANYSSSSSSSTPLTRWKISLLPGGPPSQITNGKKDPPKNYSACQPSHPICPDFFFAQGMAAQEPAFKSQGILWEVKGRRGQHAVLDGEAPPPRLSRASQAATASSASSSGADIDKWKSGEAPRGERRKDISDGGKKRSCRKKNLSCPPSCLGICGIPPPPPRKDRLLTRARLTQREKRKILLASPD